MNSSTLTNIESRRQWAEAMIRRCTDAQVSYGSPEWVALPEASCCKVAAVVRAAEGWARQGDDLEANLRLEVELSRRAFKADEDEDYQARAAEHRERWRHLSVLPPARYVGQQVRPLEDIGRDYMANRTNASRRSGTP